MPFAHFCRRQFHPLSPKTKQTNFLSTNSSIDFKATLSTSWVKVEMSQSLLAVGASDVRASSCLRLRHVKGSTQSSRRLKPSPTIVSWVYSSRIFQSWPERDSNLRPSAPNLSALTARSRASLNRLPLRNKQL